MAVSLNNGKVQVWDVRTGRRRVLRQGWDGLAGDVRFSPDGRLIAAAGQDGTARIWSAESGARLAVLRHPDDFVSTVSFSPDSTLVATANWDGGVRVWPVTGGEPVAALMHRGPVNDAVFSKDGRVVLTASDDGTARLWDFRRNRSVVLRAHLEGVNDAVFSPDGALVATAGADGARLWRATDGREVAFHPGGAGSVEFDRTGRRLLTTSGDVARLWDARSGDLLAGLTNNGPVYAAGMRPDGIQVFTAAVEGASSTVRVWRTRGTQQPTGVLKTGFSESELSPNGRLVAVLGPGRSVRILRTADLRKVASLPLSGRPTLTRFSADGRLLLVGDGRGTASLWSTEEWKPGPALRAETEVEGAAFSRDGRLIATVSGGTARVWRASTGDPLPGASVVPQGTEACGPPSDPEFSPDGSFIVLEGCASQMWDFRRRASSTTLLRVDGDTAQEVEFSRDGRLVLGQAEDTAILWRVDGIRLDEIARRSGEDSALSPDGTLAATVSRGTTEIWRPASGKTVTALSTRDDFPRVAFDPTGRFLVTVGDAVRLSDALSGTTLASLTSIPPSDPGISVAVSDDGTRIVVLAFPPSGGARVLLYQCAACGRFEDVLALARRQASRLREP